MKASAEHRHRMLELATSKLMSKPLYVATSLGLPDLLAEEPRTCEQLAPLIGAHPPSLARLLRALTSLGIFHQDEGGRFATAEMGQLVRDRPGTLRALVLWMNDPRHDRIWDELLHSVKTGETGAQRALSQPFWDYLSAQPDLQAVFDACMSANAAAMHTAAIGAYDFPASGTIVDVGGGQGALLGTILAARPGVRGILFDRPQVVEGARRRLAQAGQLDRCEVIGGDFFAGVPVGDMHVMSHIIHDWDDERSLRLLRNCFQACRPGGRVALVEMIVPPGNQPAFVKLLDLEMLVVAGGKERTEEEYRTLLGQAGYQSIRVVASRGPASVIEGTRPAN